MLAPIKPITECTRPIADLIREGDFRAATATCAREHGPSVGRLCMAMLGNQAEADEVAQETFLAAYRSMANFRAEGTIRAWLFGIARRQCARRIERGPRQHLELVANSHHAQETSDQPLHKQQLASQLYIQLDKLKPSERDLLLLRFAGDLSFREVADILTIDEATARKRSSRALARLRTFMQAEEL